MRLKQKEAMYADCSTSFSAVLTSEKTVGDLLNKILKRKEWGLIYFLDEKNLSVVGAKSYKYDGSQCNEIPAEFLQRDIIKVDARGGYSEMNYYVQVK